MEQLKKGSRLHALLPWIIPGAFVLVWVMVSYTELIPHYLLPNPLKIIKTGSAYIFSTANSPYAGRFLSDAGASLTRVFFGFFAPSSLGSPWVFSPDGWLWLTDCSILSLMGFEPFRASPGFR